jgi:poly(A) polymerase
MKISGDWLTQVGTQSLCAALERAGYQALFVGGCVRNAVLGIPVSDIDIATDAVPESVTNCAVRAGFRVVPTGIEHGTVTVIANGISHEVTTFRRDVETDGRRATVAFSTDVGEDAARRDFTMNALYADSRGRLIDPLAGLADLLAHRLRFVGDPFARIREDYLRILRFFRFYAYYGDPGLGIDAEGLAACSAMADGIDGLSRERVGTELCKLLAAADPAPAMAAMAQSGVLGRALPGADSRALGPLVHLESGMTPRWQRRLAVLGGLNVGKSLRLSRAETVSNLRIRDEVGGPLTPAALGWRLGPIEAIDTCLARAALLEQPLPTDWRSEIDRGAKAVLPVSAADLMPLLQGVALGACLKEIEALWLASNLRLDRAALLG